MNVQSGTKFSEVAVAQIMQELGGPADLQLFGRLFAEGLDPRVVTQDSVPDLIRQSFDFSQSRPSGRHTISVRQTDSLGGDGEQRTLIEIANDDMPFLVDSILGELRERGHTVYLILHPILKVERSAAGNRDRVLGTGDNHWGDGQQESHILVVVEPMTDDAELSLQDGLDAVLAQVRLAVRDWRAILKRFGEALGELEHSPSHIAPGTLNDSLEFCQWLIVGNSLSSACVSINLSAVRRLAIWNRLLTVALVFCAIRRCAF